VGVTRKERLREELRREASDILRKMKDPRVGFVSVTDVEVSQDLRHVKVFVSIFGSDEDKERTLEALEHARGFVRTEIGRRIRLRHTPEIHFRLDESIERGHRINALLRTVAADPAARDGTRADDGARAQGGYDAGSDDWADDDDADWDDEEDGDGQR